MAPVPPEPAASPGTDRSGPEPAAQLLRTPRWPFAAIVLLVALMVVIPTWEGERRGELLDRMASQVAPARTALREMERVLASSAEETRGFLVTHDTTFLTGLRKSRVQVRLASAELESVAARLGPEVATPLRELHARTEEWNGFITGELNGARADTARARSTLLSAQPRLDSALDAVARVDAGLQRVAETTRSQIHASEILEDVLVGGLAIAAVVVSLFVAWLLRRISASEDYLRQIAAERERLLGSERQARAEAETALQVRDQVLRIISHDLRNPIHTVGMAVEALELPIPDDVRAKQIGIIRRTIQRANRLLLDLLDVSRIQSGHAIAVAPTPVDTPALLADAAEAHAFQAADRQVELECDVTEGTPAVLADHDRVLQVLSNLVGNALKFTPEGGRVRLDAGPDGPDMVRFSVSDTGPGIPAEEIPYVFEPFTQAKDTATLGTGLGLSIARGIVEAHGGTISVESHPGEGAIFRFTLPVAATRAAEGAGEPADGARGAAAP